MVLVFSLGVWKIWVHAFGRGFGGQKYAVLYYIFIQKYRNQITDTENIKSLMI